MRNWLWAAAGAVCALALGACGPVNPVIGTGETSVMVTNDLSATITSLEVLAGAPEGFETILPTEDVETIEPGQTVQVNYEVGEATYDPGTAGSGQTDQTADQPVADSTSEGEGTSATGSADTATTGSGTEAENGEELLVDEVTGQDDTSADGAAQTTTSTTGIESMPIQGDAIRVVADGKTIVFDGLDLPSYKQVTLRVTDDGVGYVDYVDADDQTGSTKDAATQAAQQWREAQEAAKKKAEDDAAAAAAAAAAAEAPANEDATAENGTDANAGYDEGYTNTDDQGGSYGEPSYSEPSSSEPTYSEPVNQDGGSVNQNEGNCIDIPDDQIN